MSEAGDLKNIDATVPPLQSDGVQDPGRAISITSRLHRQKPLTKKITNDTKILHRNPAYDGYEPFRFYLSWVRGHEMDCFDILKGGRS